MGESTAKYFQRLVIMNKNGDYTLIASYDPKVVKQLFEEYDCTIMKAPKSLHQSCIFTFYRNNDPNNLMVAHLDRFCEDPNQSFNKSKSKLLVKENTEKLINKVREQQRLEKEEKLRESMKSEDCELISKYLNILRDEYADNEKGYRDELVSYIFDTARENGFDDDEPLNNRLYFFKGSQTNAEREADANEFIDGLMSMGYQPEIKHIGIPHAPKSPRSPVSNFIRGSNTSDIHYFA
ncbi:hypothetical protein M9Y10_042910 [Tritrichomonas musculus]|uniref:Uncharacterized protein n=1 Tax=Tritrichomonas musculus TaxID=1915356 RepID=A0ABR2JY67_9EUKA